MDSAAGRKRWQRLHRLIYVSAIAGVVHYYWLVKSDVRKPVFCGTTFALLLLYRISSRFMQKPAYVRPPTSHAEQLMAERV